MTAKTWWADAAALLGRVFVTVSLIPNGLSKIPDFAKIAAGMGGVPTMVHGHPFPGDARLFFPFPEFFLFCSITFDVIGSALLIVGLFSRPIAIWMFLYCSLAVIIYHTDFQNPGATMALLRGLPMLGGLLLLAAFGAGNWSLDGWRKGRANKNSAPTHV